MQIPATGSGTNAPSATKGFDFGAQKEMFLELLVAQLQNQDPTAPMDQKDMMGQMAQFSTVEQMTNMVKTLESMQANATFSQSVGLIGKTIDYLDQNENLIEGGVVNAVSTVGGVSKLVLTNGMQVDVGSVVMVR